MDLTRHGIHIFPDKVSAAAWRFTFRSDARQLVLYDDLLVGPLRACGDLESWTAMRHEYWKTVASGWLDEIDAISNAGDGARDLVCNIDHLRDASSIYIWVGSEVGDQLFLIFTIHLLNGAGIDPAIVRVLPFEIRPHHYGRFISLASCSPEDLKEYPDPVRLSTEQLDACRIGWQAATSATPTALEGFALDGPGPLPYVTYALFRLMRRYPQRDTGLTLVDTWILKNADEHGPKAVVAIANVLCETWEVGDGVGDYYLFHRMRLMASERHPHPLIQLHGDTTMYRSTEVTVTEFGRTILEGRASSYPTNAIDEWIGGVHLSSAEDHLWFHKDGKFYRHRTER